MANPFDQFDSASSANPFDQFDAPSKSKASMGTAIKSSFADVGNMADTAWSMLAGGAAGMFGQEDERDRIFREMEERNKTRQEWANPEQQELSFGGKAAGMLATLPMQVLASGLGAATTGKELIDAGESLPRAMGGAAIDAVGNAAGMMLPAGMAGNLATRALTGAAANAGQEVATKAAIQGLAQTEEGKRRFAPNVEDAALAGMMGAGFNAAAGRRPTARVESNDGVVFTPKNQPKPNVEEGGQMSLFPEDPYQGTYSDQGPQFQRDAAVTPSRGTLSNRRQMDLDLAARETLQVTPDGTAIPTSAMDPAARMAQDRAQAGRQEELFPNDPARGQQADLGPQFDPTAPEALTRGELSNARQMELQESPETMRVTQEGVAIPESQLGDTVDIKNRMQDDMVSRLDQEVEAMRQQQFLQAEQLNLPETTLQMDLFGDVPVGPIEPKNPPKRAAIDKVEAQGFTFQDGVPMRNGRSIVDQDGALKPIFRENKLLNQAVLEQKNIEAGGDLMPTADLSPREWTTWRQTFPEKVSLFAENSARDINNGLPYEQVMQDITDPRVRNQVDALVEPAYKAPTVSTWKPRSSQFKKQGGYVVIPGRNNKPRSIEQLKDAAPALFPERLSPKEWLAEYGTAKDSDKNFYALTKGGLYQAIKTGNPLIKRVTENIRTANNRAQSMIHDIVHNSKDGYAAAWRNLNNDEMVRVARTLQEASRMEADIDLGSLKAAGFSDKAIQVIRQHQDAMQQGEAIIGEAGRINGIENVNMRTAYAASMATGDFRRPVYMENASGEKKIVGMLSANTRRQLNSLMEQYKQKNPAATIGDERYAGGRARKAGSLQGYSQLMEMMRKNDPQVKEFIDAVNDIMTDSTDFRGAKKHTMEKKGIFGMAGDRMQNTPYKNAKEFADSQIQYLENTIQWLEMSKALEDAREVMGGVDMPNAKAYLNDYIANALGKNPSSIGRAIDQTMDEIGNKMGIGTTAGGNMLNAARTWANTKLLGLNPAFMLSQVVDPFKAMPAVMQYMRGMGFDKNFDFGTGYSYFGDAALKMISMKAGKKVDGITQGALDYAAKNHVYSSDLFEMSNSSRKDVPYWVHKLGQAGAQTIESTTRQAAYIGYVEMLHKNGITPKDGLYEAAHNLTDITLNNYSYTEAPLGYNVAGSMGRLPYNLMSYKHNELSKLAMMVRDLKRDNTGKALAANIASQIAFAGVMGTIGFTEADELVKLISKQMGSPTSLTSIVMGSADDSWMDNFRFGMFNMAGIDMTKRLGMDFVGDYDNPAGMLFPGGSTLWNQAKAYGQAATNPTEHNLKNAVRESVPTGLAGLVDEAWFTEDTPQGPMALSRNTGRATALRNDADVMARRMGATGLNEARQKTLEYERGQGEKFFADKRKDAMSDMQKAMSKGGPQSKDFKDALDKYIKAEGSVENFEATIATLGQNIKLTPWQRNIIKNQMARSISGANQLKRGMQYENQLGRTNED